jgi:hypothetical protein
MHDTNDSLPGLVLDHKIRDRDVRADQAWMIANLGPPLPALHVIVLAKVPDRPAWLDGVPAAQDALKATLKQKAEALQQQHPAYQKYLRTRRDLVAAYERRAELADELQRAEQAKGHAMEYGADLADERRRQRDLLIEKDCLDQDIATLERLAAKARSEAESAAQSALQFEADNIAHGAIEAKTAAMDAIAAAYRAHLPALHVAEQQLAMLARDRLPKLTPLVAELATVEPLPANPSAKPAQAEEYFRPGPTSSAAADEYYYARHRPTQPQPEPVQVAEPVVERDGRDIEHGLALLRAVSEPLSYVGTAPTPTV